MPFLYIYSPSDFVGGLPNEVGAAAAGTPNFTLTLVPGAQPTLVEVTDNDSVFDEVDGNQVVTNDVVIDGNAISAGTSINTAYDLINTSSDHRVTSLHFGGDGYQQGAVDGLVSTVPLQGGVSYTFDRERTSHQKNNQYEDYVACLAAGTQVLTAEGSCAVETLKPGDLVQTLDAGLQPVQMLISRRLSAHDLQSRPKLRPIRIAKGALGRDVPRTDLLVSPQHRMFIASRVAEKMFGHSEVLVPAKKLLTVPGVSVAEDVASVCYCHVILEGHHILFAEGAPTESFFCGPMALLALPADARQELQELFPDLDAITAQAELARFAPDGKKRARLLWRHTKNNKPLLDSNRSFG